MKIEEQALSREQMAHLIELGVDTSDASMMWVWILNKESEEWAIYINNSIMKSIASMSDDGAKRFIPTYTIGDLIEKLSKAIEWDFGINYIYYEIACKDVFNYDFEGVGLLNKFYAVLCWVAENHKELIK